MKCAQQAKVVFDVGANVGLYSLAAAASCPDAVIHAFEPTEEMVERLRKNIALNRFHQIIVNPIAVGQGSGQVYLHYSGGQDGSNQGMNFVSAETLLPSDRVVPVISLDDYCQQQHIEVIDLLKMDIEGHEYNALRGAEALLRRGALRCIFMELNNWAVERSGHTVSELVTLLGNHGYRFYQIRKDDLIEVANHRHLVDTDVVVMPGPA